MFAQRMAYGNSERVKDLLLTLGKAQRDYKTYPRNHPVLVKRREELWGKLDGILAEGSGELPLRVETEALLFEDEIVYSVPDRRESIAFNLHRNGIRELRFVTGVTREEVDSIVDAMNQDFGADDSDEDLVTVLWTRDLPHVRYEAVDDADPTADWVRDPNGALLQYLAAQRESVGNAKFETAIRFEGNKPARDPRGDIQAIMLAPEEIETLKGLIEEDEARDLVAQVIEILLEVLRASADPQQARNLLKIMEAVVEISVQARTFGRAANTLRTLSDLVPQMPHLAATLRGTIAKFAEPKQVKMLVEVVSHPVDENHRAIDELDLFRYLTLLTKAAVVPLAEAMGVIDDRKLRKTFCDALAELVKTDVSLLGGLSRDSRWFVARNVAYILGLTKNPDSLKILRSLAVHPNEKVRSEAIRAAALMGPAAKDVVNKAMNDPDRSVRMLALELIAPFRDDSTPGLLLAHLQEKEFDAKDAGEKKVLVHAAARVLGDHALAPLSILLTRRRILAGGAQDENRALAAAGIAAIGTQMAVDYLKQGIAAGEPALAQVCEHALREARLL